MSGNGTRPAVLVGDLLRGDGPFRRAADDFVTDTCSRCRDTVGRDGAHAGDGFYCSRCWVSESLAS
jgi:hypothetical protein